jgi:hypothetical protein
VASHLNRKAMAEFLRLEGFPVSYRTLVDLAIRKEGPPYQIWGNRALYQVDRALRWAHSRLGPIIVGHGEPAPDPAPLPSLWRTAPAAARSEPATKQRAAVAPSSAAIHTPKHVRPGTPPASPTI